MTPSIDRIGEIAKDIPGWSPVDELYTLFTMVYLTSHLEGDIVEIGSWCGRSTCALGLAAKQVGNTSIHCIDLFPKRDDWKRNNDGSYSFDVMIGNQIYEGYKEQTVWKEPFEKDIAPIYDKYEDIYDCFMESIRKNDLLDLVKVFRGTSSMFSDSCGDDFKCKLVFIDGDHSYKAVRDDVKNMEQHLVEGGWICFDDAFSHYNGVDRAIKDLIINGSAYDLWQQMTRKLFIARKKKSGQSR